MSPGSTTFRDELLTAGVLVATSVPGLYHRSGSFEAIARGVAQLAHRTGTAPDIPVLYFPPLIPRDVFELTDYLRSFPDLVGSIDTFVGDDRDHAELLRLADSGGDWTSALAPAEVMLCSAACHSLYPSLSGTLAVDGRVFEVEGFCFRHEPSLDPARLQSFRMREFVYVGTPEGARQHRDSWLQRGLDLLGGLGLPVTAVVANDPFFGRAGRMLAANQRDAVLKWEIVMPIADPERPTAIASANCHEDHFSHPFGISTPDGTPAHTACIGFGLERITLALLRTHGLDPAAWPAAVREQLSL